MKSRFLVILSIMVLCGIGAAYARTTATFGQQAVGQTCSKYSHATDFDTVAQCNNASGASGTLQTAPLVIGTVTSPPYAATTCDANKAGMLQYTASTMQYCNGSTWSILGTTASGVSGQSMYSGFPDAIVCGLASGTKTVFYPEFAPYSTGTVIYVANDEQGTRYAITYTAAGAYSANTNAGSYDCVTSAYSIAQLISGGKAFNFVNGGGGVNTMVDGTAAAPGLYFTSDPNTGFYRPTTDTIGLATNGTEVVRVTATGSVGIGTTSPGAFLSVQKDDDNAFHIYGAGTNTTGMAISNTSTGGHSYSVFTSGSASGLGPGHFGIYDNTAAAARLILTSTGNVGIGTTLPSSRLHVHTATGNVIIASAEDGTLGTRIISKDASVTGAPHFIGHKSRGTIASPSTIYLGDILGSFLGMGHDGTDYYTGGEILMYASQNWTSSAHGSFMTFRTVADGATASSERMRIASNGNVGIANINPGAKLSVGDTTGNGNFYVGTNDTTAEGAEILLQGAGSYDSWYIDLVSNTFRVRTSSANTDTVYMGNYGAGSLDLSVEGNLGLGAGTSSAVLYLGNSGTRYLQYNGTSYYLNGAGLYVNGTFYASDRRLKTDIAPISENRAMDTINKLEAKRFHWNPDSEQGKLNKSYDFGLIAQDVQKIIPEVVSEMDMTAPPSMLNDITIPKTLNQKLGKTLALDYQKLIPWLLAGLQEVAKQLQDLEGRVNTLLNFEPRIKKLEAENEKLKAQNVDLIKRLERLESKMK